VQVGQANTHAHHGEACRNGGLGAGEKAFKGVAKPGQETLAEMAFFFFNTSPNGSFESVFGGRGGFPLLEQSLQIPVIILSIHSGETPPRALAPDSFRSFMGREEFSKFSRGAPCLRGLTCQHRSKLSSKNYGYHKSHCRNGNRIIRKFLRRGSQSRNRRNQRTSFGSSGSPCFDVGTQNPGSGE